MHKQREYVVVTIEGHESFWSWLRDDKARLAQFVMSVSALIAAVVALVYWVG